MNGIYKVRFSSQGQENQGLAVIQNGKINGGDPGFLYLGTFSESGDAITAKLKVKRWNPGAQSIFGPMSEFDLNLTGKGDDSNFDVSGSVAQQPTLRIKILGYKISDAA